MSEGDQDMGTADMHGGEVIFKDREGNEVGFEMARLGTMQELETVKAALATEREQVNGLDKLNGEQAEKLRARAENLATTERVYRETREELATVAAMNTAAIQDGEKVESERNALREDNRTQAETIEEVSAALRNARAELEDTMTRLNIADSKIDASRHEVARKDAELEDLMTVKASLEESTTALEVRDKELCESKALLDSVMAERELYSQERDESRADLTSVKVGLLDALTQHVETHKTWLDQIRETLLME